MARELKDILEAVVNKEEGWKQTLKEATEEFSEDIIETLEVLAKSKDTESEDYKNALRLVNARIVNLESNLHIEIDMERIEDRSKALSYIGIEIADALKLIPTPQEDEMDAIIDEAAEILKEENKKYIEETTFEVKPSLWQRIKESKFGYRTMLSARFPECVPTISTAVSTDNNP